MPDHFIQVAAAIEVLHLSTLIHDDVIDDATVRRRGPALHTLYGRRQAVLMGDYLLSRCFSMIADGTSRENALRLASATGHICRGELRQLDETANPSFSRRAYLRRIIGKTALLFTSSLVVGANEAKASQADTATLARVGYNLGMAFQVIDDLLDFTADHNTLGKPTASDLRIGLYTLPVVEAVKAEPRIRTMLCTPPGTPSEAEEAVVAIRRAGGFDAARRTAEQYTLRAERAIASLSSKRQRAVLMELTQRLLHRTY
jgi:heptaprenyl diphosphate synthase